MNEVKTVKVDNWGSFFLQKLQNFFNKTDYCDLTLQFRDNSQLKVHRLVLSACTDFFNILETTTECTDDILLMPRDLQADVVVPIVNFMYTGTLEFELRMYERLLKTARDMKMSVLLKLLEAHRRSMPTKQEPIILNRSVTSRPAMRGGGYTSRGRPPGRPATYGNRFSVNNADDDAGSDFERLRRTGIENPTGKRPMGTSILASSPPAKKLNLQDVKEYTEAARLRKQLNEGDDDGGDYEMDDNYSQSSNEETTPRQSISLLASNNKRPSVDAKTELTTATVTLQELPGQKMDHAKIISEVMKKYPHLLKDNKNIKLKITQKTPSSEGTSYTVRAEVGTPATSTGAAATSTPAAKPNPLAKALLASKAQAQARASTATATAGRSLVAPKSATASPAPAAPKGGNRIDSRTMHKLIAMGAENTEGPWLCLRCGVDGKPIGIPTYRAFRKHLINTHGEKVDPRLCEHCGQRSKNRMELYHHILVKHQISPPQGFSYPKCPACKFIGLDNAALDAHSRETGHGKTLANASRTRGGAAAQAVPIGASAVTVVKKGDTEEYQCDLCDKSFPTRKAASMHRVAKHTRSRRSKKIDEEEDEEEETEGSADEADVDFDSALTEDVDYVPKSAAASSKSVKVLSEVAIKGKTRSSEAESLTTVATGIATSLRLGQDEEVVVGNDSVVYEAAAVVAGDEEVDEAQYIEEALASVHGESKDQMIAEDTKFLDEDGTELQLTAAQRAELISQLDTSTATGDEAVEGEDDVTEESITVGDESAEVLKDGDEVLMVYGGPKAKDSGKEAKKNAEEAEVKAAVEEEEEEGVQNMELEENPAVDEEAAKNEKNKLIKELEGDWSDDAEENGEEKPVEESEGKGQEPVESEENAVKKEVEEAEVPETAKELLEVETKEEVSIDEPKADEVSEKKAPEATLAEFMNDWSDE